MNIKNKLTKIYKRICDDPLKCFGFLVYLAGFEISFLALTYKNRNFFKNNLQIGLTTICTNFTTAFFWPIMLDKIV